VDHSAVSKNRIAASRSERSGLPLVAASADQRGFLVIYERPGSHLNLADVYELVGMAVVG
jgi:hypothetical protein